MPSRARLTALVSLARAALTWERLWPRLWPAASVIGAFLGLALMDVLPRLPSWLHAAILAAFAGALVASLWLARSGFRLAGRDAATRRVERDSQLAHRPLTAIDDRLVAGRNDPVAESLWQRHQSQMVGRLDRLRVGWPHTGIDSVEPWGIRAAVLLLIAVGLAAGWRETDVRLARAIDPGLGFGIAQRPVVEVWISPPAYTRAAPIFLRHDSDAAAAAAPAQIDVPEGSSVRARVNGARGQPVLELGTDHRPFAALDDRRAGAFGVEAEVRSGERLAVVVGRRALAEWPIRVIEDRPPEIGLITAPAASGNGVFSVVYAASDDHGVTSARAVLRRADAAGSEAAEVELDLPLAAADPRDVQGESRHDLAAHRWAGAPVVMQLFAEDEPGRVGRSEAVPFVLPERQFSHPVAQQIIAARKTLHTDDPVTRRGVASHLQAIAARPEAYEDDVVVQLALAVAKSRLAFDVSEGAIDSVRDLLWATALRLEEGEVPAAERAVAQARQQLSEALARDAPLEEIERLMDELQAALDRYLEALAAELARRGQAPAHIDPRLMAAPATDLQEMVDAARQMVRAGARDSAERMLADLQRLLEQLRAGLPLGGLPPAMAEAEAILDALSRMRDQQQGLLDQTFERLRTMRDRLEQSAREQPPASSGQPTAAAGAAQEELRARLAELIARAQGLLGSVPGALPEAEQAMRAAARALDQGRLNEGGNRQGQAVDALGRALDALGQSLANALGGGNAIMMGSGGMPGRGQGDVFGRNPPGGRRGLATGSTPIPDASSLRRAEEILNELRRRAGEPARPATEREYIDRMLRRY